MLLTVYTCWMWPYRIMWIVWCCVMNYVHMLDVAIQDNVDCLVTSLKRNKNLQYFEATNLDLSDSAVDLCIAMKGNSDIKHLKVPGVFGTYPF